MTLKQSDSPYGYKNLLVYKKAEELQSLCSSVTALFPHLKTLYSLADQMNRSARSIKQNIVEGWKRNSTKEYHEFLGFSLGANAELEEDCNDIIRGVYKEMGLKRIEKREEGEERGAAGAQRPPQRETPSAPSTPYSRSAPWTLDEVELLPFYPLATHLPLLVQLKLRCKELNMLLDKLQRSLIDKMSADHTLGQREMQGLARGHEAANDAWLQRERGKWEEEEKGNKREKRV